MNVKKISSEETREVATTIFLSIVFSIVVILFFSFFLYGVSIELFGKDFFVCEINPTSTPTPIATPTPQPTTPRVGGQPDELSFYMGVFASCMHATEDQESCLEFLNVAMMEDWYHIPPPGYNPGTLPGLEEQKDILRGVNDDGRGI